MAIVKMSRFSLTAFQSEKAELLQALQELDEVAFRDLPVTYEEMDLPEDVLKSDRATVSLSAVQTELLHVENAIEDLTKELPKPGFREKLNSALPQIGFSELEEEAGAVDAFGITEGIRDLKTELVRAEEEMKELRAERRRLRPYLDLDVEPGELKKLETVRAVVGSLPKRWLDELRKEIAEVDYAEMEVLSSGDKTAHILVFYDPDTEVEEILSRNAFRKEELPEDVTPARWTREAAEKSEILEAKIERIEAQIKEMALTHLNDLKMRAEVLRSEEARELARANLLAGHFVFITEGYLPEERADELRAKLDAVLEQPYDFHIETVERDDEDIEDVPIMLRNSKVVKPFEQIVSTFSMPKYNETDPTALLLPWFAMSFGLMLGDLGYGMVMWLLSFVALKFFRLKEGMRLSLGFFHILSYPTMLAGLIYGSFFGFSLFEKPLVVIASTDPNAEALINLTGNPTMDVMILAVAFGLVMLFFGLAIKGYLCIRDGDWLGLFADVICWYMAVGGALIMIFGSDIGVSEGGVGIAKILMVVGMVGIVLFSAREEKSKVAQVAWGAYNLYGISSWIGDLISYTRIAALAMSGGFIGYSVNMISGMLFDVGFVGKLAGVVVLVIFHAFNLFLSGLSGYVHTLRLTYVEFFSKFYEGGGRRFEKFRPEGKYLDVR